MPLYDGGGAGANRDRFYFMDVHNMWDMLQYHDTAPHQQALKGWRQSYELVLMHKTQVEKYREKLITAWPPERSKAARAYVERLDHLIESLSETYEAAIANYSAYSTAIAAVDDAKYKLQAIKQEHAANTDALTKYAEEMRDRPRAYGKAIAPPPPPSPVTDGRQEQLRLQAAGLMTGLSAELATAQMSLTAPKPYSPQAAFNDASESFNSGGGVPVLPALQTSFSQTPKSAPKVTKPSTSGTGIRTPERGNTEQPGGIKNPSDGPILGGTKQPLNPPTTGLPSTLSPALPTGGSPPDPLTLTPTQGNPSNIVTRYPSTNGGPLGGTPVSTSPLIPGTKSGSPLHGGIIGGTPPMSGTPSGRAGQAGSSARGTHRVNSLGGMIGQSTAIPPSRRTASQSGQDSRSQSWDPDNPWETDSGIDPVLSPQPEQRINPGPTIGGR